MLTFLYGKSGFTELVEALSGEVTAKSLGELKAVVRTLGEMAAASGQKDMEALCQAADQALIHRPVLDFLDTLADMGKWFTASLRWHSGDGAPPPPPMALWGRFRSGQVKAPTESEAEQDEPLGTEQAEAKAAFVEQAGPCIEIFELLVDVLHGQVTAKNLGELKGLIRSLHEAATDFADKDMEALCQAADQALIHRPASELLDHLADMGKWLGQNLNWRAGQGAPPPPPMALWGRFQSGQAAAKQVDEVKPGADDEGGPEPVQSQEIDEKNREHVIQFVRETLDLVETASIHLLTLATEPDNGEAIEGIYISYHTIKGMAGFVKLQDIRRLSGELEQLLNKLRGNTLVADGVLLDVVYEASGALADLLESAQVAAMKGDPLPFNVE